MVKEKISNLEKIREIIIGEGSFAVDTGIRVKCISEIPLFFSHNKYDFKNNNVFHDYNHVIKYLDKLLKAHVKPYSNQDFAIDGTYRCSGRDSKNYSLNFKQMHGEEGRRARLLKVDILFTVK